MTQCECWELEKASYWICVHNTHPSSAVGTAVLQAKQKKTAKQFSAAINPFAEYLNIHRFPMCKLDVAFKGLWFVISDLWHCLFMILAVCCHLRPWNFLFFEIFAYLAVWVTLGLGCSEVIFVLFVFHNAFRLVLSLYFIISLCCLCFILLSVWCYLCVILCIILLSVWCYFCVVCVS